jgi:hypothetical protein
MMRLIQLLFAPFATWTKVAEANRHVLLVLLVTALPMMVVGSALEGWCMTRWGISSRDFGETRLVRLAQSTALRFCEYRLGLDVALLILSALLVHLFASSFQTGSRFGAALELVAYALGPIWIIGRGLDALPMVPTWLCWGGGVLLTLYLLYHGVGLLLKPDQTKGFGLLMVTSLTLVVLSALTHFVSLTLLKRLL